MRAGASEQLRPQDVDETESRSRSRVRFCASWWLPAKRGGRHTHSPVGYWSADDGWQRGCGCLDTDCDDNNPCTVDSCTVGACSSVPGNLGIVCDDASAATCRDACTAGGCSGTASCSPCADLCSKPVSINNVANPSTASAICYELTTAAQGASVGGKGLEVNGRAVTSDGIISPWPAKRFGGYCFQSKAGFGWLSPF